MLTVTPRGHANGSPRETRWKRLRRTEFSGPAAPRAAPRALEAAVLRRPAGAAKRKTKSFQQCWSAGSVRKKNRFACVSDFLDQVGTPAASKFRPTVGERLRRMSQSSQCKWGTGAITTFPEFGARRGGGKPGLGGSKLALQDVFKITSGR